MALATGNENATRLEQPSDLSRRINGNLDGSGERESKFHAPDRREPQNHKSETDMDIDYPSLEREKTKRCPSTMKKRLF